MTTSWYRVVVLFLGSAILTACGGSESAGVSPSGSGNASSSGATSTTDSRGIEGTGNCDTPGCANASPQNPGPPHPVPAVSSVELVSPGPFPFDLGACVPAGALGFTLSVFGSGFSTASVVEVNGNARPTTLVTNYPNKFLSAQISASDVGVAGSAAITVSNPAPGGGRSNAAALTIAPAGAGGGGTSVALDPTGQFAYVTIHDCSALDVGNGSVSIYRINTTTGVPTPLGLVPSGDWGANSIAITPDGRFAYVGSDADSGDGGSMAGGVSVFSADPTTGILTLKEFQSSPCGPQPAPGSCTPYSVAMHPSGKFLYVANEGGLAPTSVSMYSIDTTTGNLTLIGLIATGGRAVSIAVDPSGAFAYVINENYAGLTPSVAMFTINATTGALTLVGTIVGDTTPAGVTVDPTGRFVYVTDAGSNDVSMYAINATTGALTPIGQIAAGTAPAGVLVDPTGKFLYVTNVASNNVSMYTRDTTTGALTSMGQVAAGVRPGAVTIDPTGTFVYVTNSTGFMIFRIDASTGALALVGTIST